jgi:V/A-type H+-transporting ATPase subunit K
MKLDNRITSLVLFIAGAFVFVLALIPNVSALVPGTPGGFEALQIADAGLGILGIAIGAGLALGLAGLGASIGMGTASAAALGAITEKPETFGKSILYVVFIEAVAIYGFVIAFLLVGYIPNLIGG